MYRDINIDVAFIIFQVGVQFVVVLIAEEGLCGVVVVPGRGVGAGLLQETVPLPAVFVEVFPLLAAEGRGLRAVEAASSEHLGNQFIIFTEASSRPILVRNTAPALKGGFDPGTVHKHIYLCV